MSPGEVVLGGVSGPSAEVLVKLTFNPFILRGLFPLRELWIFSTVLLKLSPSSKWSSSLALSWLRSRGGGALECLI